MLGVWRPEEGTRFPGIGVTAGVRYYMGSGNQILAITAGPSFYNVFFKTGFLYSPG